jgi:hypothetical protein
MVDKMDQRQVAIKIELDQLRADYVANLKGDAGFFLSNAHLDRLAARIRTLARGLAGAQVDETAMEAIALLRATRQHRSVG